MNGRWFDLFRLAGGSWQERMKKIWTTKVYLRYVVLGKRKQRLEVPPIMYIIRFSFLLAWHSVVIALL